MQDISRRQFLKLGICAAAALALPVPRLAWSSARARELAFHHLHTGESLRLAYFENGTYISSALAAIDHVLRDHRTGDIHAIDPRLLDQLHSLQSRVDAPGAFQVICGYRSPHSNTLLRSHSTGVATKSLHLQGRAIDIRLPGKDLAHLRDAALDMRAGGVGYYPQSGFIHIDTGRVRRWG